MNSDDEVEPFRILVVCRANVCRSPSAEFMLLRSVAGGTLAGAVVVSSAGTRGEEGLGWCQVAARGVSDGPDRQQFITSHRSRLLDAEMVARSDLVLTAERVQRAAVLHVLPTASVRTFTLREAAALATATRGQLAHSASETSKHRPVNAPAFVISALPVDSTRPDRLRWLVSEMHSARGLVPLPAAKTTRGWLRRRRSVAGGIDIPDAHGPQRVRHRPALLQDAVDSWVRAAEATLAEHGG